MRTVKQRIFFLSCFVFLFSSQLSFASHSEAIFASFEIDELETDSSSQNRILGQTISSRCFRDYCTYSHSLISDNSLSYSITLNPGSKVALTIQVGTARKEMNFALSTNPKKLTRTNIWLAPSDSYPNPIGPSVSAAGWRATLGIYFSDSSTRTLLIEIENASSETIDMNFQIIVVLSIEETNSRSWLLSVLGAAAAILFLFTACCICCRIRKRIRQRRFQAAYEQRRANRRRNTGSVYLPVNQLSPHSSQQPGQNYPQRDYQMPLQGPLEEWNFDHRFPQAPFESFTSPFVQKMCSICLGEMGTNQNCRQLYCEHIFHSECVKLWLLSQMHKQHKCFCPNCNKNMTLVEERQDNNVDNKK